MKALLENGLLHGDCLTVTGKTIKENLAMVPSLSTNQKIIAPLSSPFAAPMKRTLKFCIHIFRHSYNERKSMS
jgi:dihydroxyacid dehydratase/phosphogluconate dehydratase